MKDFDFNNHIRLENEHACLEPLEMRHFNLLKDIIARDEGLMKYSGIRVQSVDDLRTYIAIALQAKAEKQRYAFAIFDKKTNGYAGSTSFANISDKDARLEIGYTWISYAHQRTGLNSAMKYLMLQYAFENLEYMRVELRADSRNVQSRTAMERIGALYEGSLRSHMVLPDGYRRDTVCYSILADEWPKIKQERFMVMDYA